MGALVGGSIAVLSGYALGAQWLGSMVVGVPTGLWLVGGAVLGTHVYTELGLGRRLGRRARVTRRRLGQRGSQPRLGIEDRGQVGTAGVVDERDVGSGGVAGVGGLSGLSGEAISATVLELGGVPARQVRAVRTRLDRLTDRLRSGQPTVRVGLDVSEQTRRAIVRGLGEQAMVGGVPIKWEKAESGLMSEGPRDARRFDVLVRESAGGEGAGREVKIGVFAGGGTGQDVQNEERTGGRRLRYAALFPARVRCDARVLRLSGNERVDERSGRLIGALAVVAGVAARTAGRVGGGPEVGDGGAGGRGLLPDGATVLAAAMNGLADALLEHRGPAEHADAPAGVAAEVIGQYATTVGVDLPSGACVDLARLSADTMPDDPAATLRLGAAELAWGEQEEGTRTLVRAFRQIRSTPALGGGVVGGGRGGGGGGADALAFVMSEAELGARDAITFGRVCAGICLAWATTSTESLDYLQDDLIDDLKHAGWLVGREHEVERLRTIIGALEREVLGGRRGVELKRAA